MAGTNQGLQTTVGVPYQRLSFFKVRKAAAINLFRDFHAFVFNLEKLNMFEIFSNVDIFFLTFKEQIALELLEVCKTCVYMK